MASQRAVGSLWRTLRSGTSLLRVHQHRDVCRNLRLQINSSSDVSNIRNVMIRTFSTPVEDINSSSEMGAIDLDVPFSVDADSTIAGEDVSTVKDVSTGADNCYVRLRRLPRFKREYFMEHIPTIFKGLNIEKDGIRINQLRENKNIVRKVFVKFATPEDAQKAVAQGRRRRLGYKDIRVIKCKTPPYAGPDRSVNGQMIVMKNLPPGSTEDDVLEFLDSKGPPRAVWMHESGTKCTIDFLYHSQLHDAMTMNSEYLGTNIVEMVPYQISKKHKTSNPESTQAIEKVNAVKATEKEFLEAVESLRLTTTGHMVRMLYLPQMATFDCVRELLHPLSPVEIRMLKDETGDKMCAVDFATQEEAEAAAKKRNTKMYYRDFKMVPSKQKNKKPDYNYVDIKLWASPSEEVEVAVEEEIVGPSVVQKTLADKNIKRKAETQRKNELLKKVQDEKAKKNQICRIVDYV